MDTLAPSTVLLRDVTNDDLPIFFEQQLDPVATQMAAFPARERPAFMAHWAKVLADPTNKTQAILFEKQVAGNIASFEMSGEREVGYWLGRQYWGKGIATAALAAFLQHELVRPLYAHVAQHNRGSLRVLEKCGFTIIGEDSNEQVEEYVLKLNPSEQPR